MRELRLKQQSRAPATEVIQVGHREYFMMNEEGDSLKEIGRLVVSVGINLCAEA